jgi:hypothetical protein
MDKFPGIFTDKKLMEAKKPLIKGIQKNSPGILELAF